MLPLVRLYGDWATKTLTEKYISSLLSSLSPLLRLALALAVSWTLGGGMDRPRQKTAVLFGVVTAFLTVCELGPLLSSTEGVEGSTNGNGGEYNEYSYEGGTSASPIAYFALQLLTFTAFLVGMATGSLLPRLLMGVSLGAVGGLLVVSLAGVLGVAVDFGFPVVAGGLGVIMGGVTCWHPNNPLFLPLATILIIGALASGIAVPSLFTFLKSIVLGTTTSTAVDAHWLLLTWLIASLFTTAVLIYRDSTLLGFLRGGYTPVNNSNNSGDDKTLKPNTDITPQPVYASPHPPTAGPEAFDIFDPADLPPRLSEYANMVYSACEDLGNFFGFQDSSVRNQAEHVLILLSNNRRYMNSHILPPALQPPSPIHALHAKVFSNYMKWCRYQGVPPHFSRASSASAVGMEAPPSVASRVVDLILFFCVWGEACIIRHMPECLWFLYHKMMEEYTVSEHNAAGGGYPHSGGGRSLYAGHFLDYVVMPIYKIVSVVSKTCVFVCALLDVHLSHSLGEVTRLG